MAPLVPSNMSNSDSDDGDDEDDDHDDNIAAVAFSSPVPVQQHGAAPTQHSAPSQNCPGNADRGGGFRSPDRKGTPSMGTNANETRNWYVETQKQRYHTSTVRSRKAISLYTADSAMGTLLKK